jgi:hypothetical protein
MAWQLGLQQQIAHQEQLRQSLSRQRSELDAIVQQLEREQRLVPPVDDVQWQGPARGAYEMLVDRLRDTLAASLTALRAAERSSATALATLADRVR